MKRDYTADYVRILCATSYDYPRAVSEREMDAVERLLKLGLERDPTARAVVVRITERGEGVLRMIRAALSPRGRAGRSLKAALALVTLALAGCAASVAPEQCAVVRVWDGCSDAVRAEVASVATIADAEQPIHLDVSCVPGDPAAVQDPQWHAVIVHGDPPAGEVRTAVLGAVERWWPGQCSGDPALR